MSLHHDMEQGEAMVIGDNEEVVIRVQHKSGRKVRLSIDTQMSITVDRKNKNLYDNVAQARKRAIV